jgi:hypothetical protein
MRNNSIASLLVVAIIVLVVVGFMRGWFQFMSSQTPAGKVEMELSIDPDKARHDAEKVRRKADEFIDKVQSEATEATENRDPAVNPAP